MNKKFTALLTAVSLVLPLCHVALADPAPTQPEVTVVGKRITGDDTYFEISLEVNRDYEEYSAVGVVLRYDPAYIVPAESWDEDAGELDLYTEGARTWGTRRALPTLGKDTWSTQTALAYEDDFLDLVSGTSKKWGYLYLGAEYPGTTPDDSSATASPGVATPSPTPTPTVDPSVTPDPDIYQNPVVAVRFMYKEDAATLAGGGDSAAARKATKEKLEQTWLDTAGNGANSWDGANWPNNEILTIASDDIAKTSPAQYPFAYYRADLEEYAYLHTWPSPAPTADPSGTPLPIDVQLNLVKEVGADVDPAHQLGNGDIEVCLGEGKSAKATGGLQLSDIFVILFYDWDDSLLGTLTTGVGVDATEAVNNYVEEKLIHPDLRTTAATPPDYAALSAAGTLDQRQYNYRGEYPYTGPNASNPTEPGGANTYPDVLDADGNNTDPNAGSEYPLTNKLDYCFAGKDMITSTTLKADGTAYGADYPFAAGWTQVTPKNVLYNATDYPNDLIKVQPKAMADTWTALEDGETFDRMPEFDASGNLNPGETIPTLISYDFSDIKAEDLVNSDGNLYVKAVYTPGEMLNGRNNITYIATGDLDTSVIDADATTITFSIKYNYRRMNNFGYGVTRLKKPGVNMSIKQLGAESSTPLALWPTNNELLEIEMMPTDAVETIDYKLVEAYGSNVVAGGERSDRNALGNITITGANNLWWKTVSAQMLEDAWNDCSANGGPEAFDWLDPTFASYTMRLCTSSAGDPVWDGYEADVAWCIAELMNDIVYNYPGVDYRTLDWYQVQYAILELFELGYGMIYVPSEDAEAELANYPDVYVNVPGNSYF